VESVAVDVINVEVTESSNYDPIELYIVRQVN
jgi:hypothetical protein